MIFEGASTSAYDENEVYLTITAEENECIRVGDVISIPMNDHTFESREIIGMFRDWKKWLKEGKGLDEIKNGEWARCIINNIHSGRIHTISSPYDDDDFSGAVCCGVYDKNVFIKNFKKIMLDKFGVEAETVKYIIEPIYDPSKNESGEDSVFRLVFLSDENIGNKSIDYKHTTDILTAFEPMIPTKIVVSNEKDSSVFKIKCSTRVRKPSAIADIEKEYAPFSVTERDGLIFRQVICPFCSHQYMTRVYEEYDLIIKHSGDILNGWNDQCPKCSSWLYIIDNKLEGVDPSLFPEEEITEHFILR